MSNAANKAHTVFIGKDGGPKGSFAGATVAYRGDVIRMQHPDSGESWHRGFYSSGALEEFGGTIEIWCHDYSIHNYNKGGATPYGQPARFWVGNPSDTGGGMLSGVQVCVMNEDGLTYSVTDQWFEIVSQRFGRTTHGDIRLIVRGPGDKIEFRGGPEAAPPAKHGSAETVYGHIGPDGLTVLGVDITAKLLALEARLAALE